LAIASATSKRHHKISLSDRAEETLWPNVSCEFSSVCKTHPFLNCLYITEKQLLCQASLPIRSYFSSDSFALPSGPTEPPGGQSLPQVRGVRTDKNPALFVTIRNPHKRLLAGGVEIMLKKIGELCDVHHVHPHKLRRTMATTAIDKGMPIEQVQRLLGHEKIDTTLHYAMVKQNNVKMSHKKYIG
jgi:hypothetical protein